MAELRSCAEEQDSPTMDPTREEEPRAAKGDLAQDCGERPEEQGTDPRNSPQDSSRPSQVEFPCHRLKHQTAQRGLID
ncbi:hypothetical protein QTP86_011315 [Hemibagrus guttatus]|nr:hypothetical protein QTP86_011315 [Hemibagrus guttatus]